MLRQLHEYDIRGSWEGRGLLVCHLRVNGSQGLLVVVSFDTHPEARYDTLNVCFIGSAAATSCSLGLDTINGLCVEHYERGGRQ